MIDPHREREAASRRKYRQTWNPRFFVEVARAVRAEYRIVGVRPHYVFQTWHNAAQWAALLAHKFATSTANNAPFPVCWDVACPNDAPHTVEWRDPVE